MMANERGAALGPPTTSVIAQGAAFNTTRKCDHQLGHHEGVSPGIVRGSLGWSTERGSQAMPLVSEFARRQSAPMLPIVNLG
jgi:hypothetical protein